MVVKYEDDFLKLAATNFANTIRLRNLHPKGSPERIELNRIAGILIPGSMSKQDYIKFSRYTMEN